MEKSGEKAKVSGISIGSDNANGKGKSKKQQEEMHVLEIHDEVLKRLRESNNPKFMLDEFDRELWAHFHRLPARYAMDVSVERAEDIIMHMKLLEDARNPATSPSFSVKVVHVRPDEDDVDTPTKSAHPPPAFGSSLNLRRFVRQESLSQFKEEESESESVTYFRPLHEITFATKDRPRCLNNITCLLGDLNLNIKECHAFSTNDGFSLDVFIVVGWHYEETEQLTDTISKELHKIAMKNLEGTWTPEMETHMEESVEKKIDHIKIPNDGTDEWEIDMRKLVFGNKVASGTYGDLYRGSYFGQDVAIKILKNDHVSEIMQKEFAQEVYIMRKVRHKNVVQFIGACTIPPTLAIITEFMSGGSLYDYLHKHKRSLKLHTLVKISIDIAKGMNYLHQHDIIHRDLKTANLLIDENEVVKVADFGVARVIKNSPGIMTAETGTYRWMAPEVIEHKPYDRKADVFSYGIVVWELLCGKVPYEYLTPLQAAIGVVQKGLRPDIPKGTNPQLVELMKKCWQQDPSTRPDFATIVENLQHIANELGVKPEENQKSGIFSILKRGI